MFRLEVLKNGNMIRTANEYQLAEFGNILYERTRLSIDFNGNTWFTYFDDKWYSQKIDINKYRLVNL